MLIVVVFAVIFKLIDLQFFQGDHYINISEEREFKNIEIPANRGNIYSDSGKLLASSVPKYNIRFDALAPSQKNSEKYVGDLDPAWNSLDGDIKPFKQLHFTNMLTQPWKPSWFDGVHEPHADKEFEQLFWDTVQDARKEGYSIDDYDPRTKPGYTPVKYKVLRGYY